MVSRRLRHGQGPFWGDSVGPNPTDRAKAGSKRSVLVDGSGGPLSVVVAGANVHNTKLLRQTLENIVVGRPDGPGTSPENLCLDKGYDNPTGRAAAGDGGYRAHLRRIGEEKLDGQRGETSSGPAVGGGADAGLAIQVAGNPGPL